MSVKLVWNPVFLISQKSRMKAAQQYVDETCVKRMQPYVPVAPARFKNRGAVLRSVKIQSPGRIVYMKAGSAGKRASLLILNLVGSGRPSVR